MEGLNLQKRLIVLQADATKTNTARVVPISQRLKGILEMRHYGPDGKELGPECYVFGTETGECRRDTRNAWVAACDAAKITDLHMHDLWRECGSRLLEAGVGIHEVRDWLGHRDISTTGRYLAITGASLQRALARLEESQKVRTKTAAPLLSGGARRHRPSTTSTNRP